MSENISFEDQTQRLFPRRHENPDNITRVATNRDRAREIREEGGVASAWFPSTIKTNATPTRTNIADDLGTSKTSPEQKVLADLTNAAVGDSPYRRARAGTVPSSFGASPGGSSDTKTSPTSTSNFSTIYRSDNTTPMKENDTLGALPDLRMSQNNSPTSRLRAGSLTLPQNRNSYSTAFGPSIFSSSWSTRAQNPHQVSSPAQSNFSRDDEQTPIKTLDYLGLAETPTPPRSLMNMMNIVPHAMPSTQPYLADIGGLRRDPNRIRSYSVNAKERYDNEYEEAEPDVQKQNFDYNEQFRGNATPSRPRSRTAGMLDSPPSLRANKFAPMQSHMETSVTAADLETYGNGDRYAPNDLTARMNGLNLEAMAFDEGPGNMNGYIQSQPTRALWLGNIPSSTPSAALLAMFSPFGSIESARVLTHKSCAFVNFDMLESAVIARTAFNGKELFPGTGAVRIGFAKVPSATSAVTPEPYGFHDSGNPLAESAADNQEAKPPTIAVMKSELSSLVLELGATTEERDVINSTMEEASKYAELYEEVPNMPEPVSARQYDAPKLRDIRKRIDNGDWTHSEVEGIALDMLPEVAELASDYLGNTVVQKLFEFCSEDVKLQMLEQIAPHLPEIGVHKNGTWAAQKIIDTANTTEEMQRVVDALRRSTPALFLDQFGNYVIQCCLKFGPILNDFIFQAMLSHTWEIAQGRYGARAMRACLESHHTSKAQQRLLAAVITIHSVQLATNANGALLLTWLLDTCMLPNRHRLLAPKLCQRLVHLCTHKLASLTVLKVINQRQEPEARDLIIESLFFSEGDKVLEGILQDQAHGPTVIFKIITTPYLEADLRTRIVANVRAIIQRHKSHPANGFKRLMDEVGLSTRGMSSMSPHESNRQGFSPVYSTSQYGSQLDPGLSGPRTAAGVDPATLQALGELSLANGSPGYGLNSHQMQQQMAQLQYQAMLQQSLRQNTYNNYSPHMAYNDPYTMNNQLYGGYSGPSYPHPHPGYSQSSTQPSRRRQ